MPGPAQRVDREEFAKLSDEGLTLTQLANHFGIHPRAVTRIRTQIGIKSPNLRKLTPERMAVIESMLEDGMPFQEIHRTEGVDMETLRKYFPGRGWTVEQSNEYRAAIRALAPKIRRNNVANIR